MTKLTYYDIDYIKLQCNDNNIKYITRKYSREITIEMI